MTERSPDVRNPYPPERRARTAPWAPRLIGREAELNALREYLDTGVLILSEPGGAGIGATALARALAAEVVEHYPNGCIEVNLQAGDRASREPLTPSQVQSRVLYTLDGFPSTEESPRLSQADAAAPPPFPENPRLLRERYFRAISSGEALVILDNVASAAQLRHLLPRGGAPVIVTSQADLATTFSGLHPLTLGGLDPDDALHLMVQVAPDATTLSRRMLNRLAARLEFIPMAVRIVAALLSSEPRRTPRELLAHLDIAQRRIVALRGAYTPNIPVSNALEVAYELLKDELKPYFEALAVFPAPFTSRAAAAIWGVPLDAARGVLRELTAAALLDHGAGSVTYEIHPLARLYAQELLLGQVNRTQRLVSRYVDHYLREAVRASALRPSPSGQQLPAQDGYVVWEHFPKAWRRLRGEDPGWPQAAEVEGWVQDFAPHNNALLSVVLSAFEDCSDTSGKR